MGFWSRLARTVRGRGHDRDIDEEIAFHLAMRQEEGLDARAARLRFGNPRAVHEEMRAAGIVVCLESLAQDVRYGLRQLRRTPLVTAAVVLSLVVGIGANSAIFTLMDAALLKPLPVEDPRSLVLLEWTSEGWPSAIVNGHTGSTDGNPAGRMWATSIGPTLHRRLAQEQRVVRALVGFSDGNVVSLAAQDRPADRGSLQYVSSHFFQALGVAPVQGRAFLAGDDEVGRELVVVVSHRLWQRAFGGREDALGQTLRINGVPATVIGIAPPRFFGTEIGDWTDAYVPLAARATLTPRPPEQPIAEQADYWWVRQFARLPPGMDGQTAATALTPLFQRLAVPESVSIEPGRVPRLVASPGHRGIALFGDDERRALLIMLLLVGIVLLIVCSNVSNLLLARALARQRESAVRLAIGAGRLRLVRQQLVEHALVGLAGGALGLWLGHALVLGLEQQVLQGAARFNLALDGRVLLYTVALSLATVLLFGLAPALRAARADVGESLRAGSRSILAGHLRLPRVLVIAQVAMCLTVLMAAGLVGRSVENLRRVDIGFDRQNIHYATVNPWRAGLDPGQVGSYVERLRSELARIAGVRRVSTIASRPLGGSSSSGTANIPGRPFVEDGTHFVFLNELGDGALETLGIALLAGRSFEARDMRPGTDAVLVDERFVERFFPDRHPIGLRFGFGRERSDQYEIVGVVRSSRYNSLRGDLRPTFYRPHVPAERRGRDVHIVLEATGGRDELGAAIHRAAARAHPDVPVTELFGQTALIDRLLVTERLLQLVSSAFGGVALMLVALGLAGLLGYAVARRSSEIGLRMALGATPGDVKRLVIRDSLWLVGLGVALGVPAAWSVARLLGTLLYGVEATDLGAASLSLAILLFVAAIAAWLPARRAARIDPLLTLRSE